MSTPPGPTFPTAEVTRAINEQRYERSGLLVQRVGFITVAAARRVSYQDSLFFHRVPEV